MDYAADEPAAPAPANQPPSMRKKIRKGTRSCWECKRRKIRCLFASPQTERCISCERRRTPCVSQDLPEDLAPATIGNRHLSARMARVEDAMRKLLAGDRVGASRRFQSEPRRDGQTPRFETHIAQSSEVTDWSSPAPQSSIETVSESTLISTRFTPDSLEASSHGDLKTKALHHLFSAYPAESDASILLEAGSRSALYTYLVYTQPHGNLTHEMLANPYQLARPSGPNIHPVNLASLMLIFAITLQSPCGERVKGLSEPSSVLQDRLVTAATTWVTSKEEMHGTLECLVCIILEAVFKTNSGNLRQAWTVYRRAITVAQMMGLHRTPLPPLKRIDANFVADPVFIWFRIVYMDRYLSLLLGFPQGTLDRSMGALSFSQHEPPLGKFEKQLTVIASRILDRNENSFDETQIAATRELDSELLRVSRSMPVSFWRPVSFHGITPGSPNYLLETVRLGAQVYYYALLIQAHLPYMMHGIEENMDQGYSQVTCVHASREIMSRFIVHRTFSPMSSCSRPVDFFALLAAMTLLLAHIDAHHHQKTTNFLAHQRLSDLAILDQALERMDVISNFNGDATTEQSAGLIRRLLEIEADAADGSSYTATGVNEDGDSRSEEVQEKAEEVRLRIPYLGVIKIARQGPIWRESSFDMAAATQNRSSHMVSPQRIGSDLALDNAFMPLPIHSQTNLQQSVSPKSFSNTHLQASGHAGQFSLHCSNTFTDTLSPQTNAELPSISAGIDDWALQGVDTAFFDALLRGTSGIGEGGLDSGM